MDDTPHPLDAPQDWIDVLEESMADLAAGRVVSGEVVRRGLLKSIARMEAKRAVAPKGGTITPR